jgi:hypothetical protein
MFFSVTRSRGINPAGTKPCVATPLSCGGCAVWLTNAIEVESSRAATRSSISRIALISLLGLILAASAFGNTASCPTNNTTTISNATIQASPAGCTQVDLQFNLASTVWQIFDNSTNPTSNPMDSTVHVTGTGIADGTGANSQGIIFSQSSGFFFDDTSSSGETATFFLVFGTADLAPNDVITAVDISFTNYDDKSVDQMALLYFACPNTTVFASCPGSSDFFEDFPTNSLTSFHNTLSAPATSLGLHIEIQTNYEGHDSLSFSTLTVAFETQSTVPEPTSLGLSLFGLATIVWLSSQSRVGQLNGERG